MVIQTNYVESEKHILWKRESSQKLGVHSTQLFCIGVQDKGHVNIGACIFPDDMVCSSMVELRNVAREKFANPSEELERRIEDYEADFLEVKQGTKKLDIKRRECPVCDYTYLGGYELSPIALHIYHEEFRQG